MFMGKKQNIASTWAPAFLCHHHHTSPPKSSQKGRDAPDLSSAAMSKPVGKEGGGEEGVWNGVVDEVMTSTNMHRKRARSWDELKRFLIIH